MLCVAAASEVSRDVEEGVESLEPWVREIPLEGPCDVDGASMVEIHLGESTDFDPFKSTNMPSECPYSSAIISLDPGWGACSKLHCMVFLAT